MFKAAILASVFFGQLAAAETRLICSDSSNTDGSYILDITGYEELLGDETQSFQRNLGFRDFRSSTQPIANVACAKPNPYLDGPNAVVACRSGMVRDYRQLEPVFEAVVYKGETGLSMKVSGPKIPSAWSIPCDLKNVP